MIEVVPRPGVTWVGVAVEVPEPWGSQVQAYRTSLGDDASGVPTHITLVPPTPVADERVPEVADTLAAAAGRCPPFAVHLLGTDSFRPVSPVAFVAVADGHRCLGRLAEAARGGPLDTPRTFPFHPHVTLAHGVDDQRLDQAVREYAHADLAFVADALTLYEHDGAAWAPRRRFSLTGTHRD